MRDRLKEDRASDNSFTCKTAKCKMLHLYNKVRRLICFFKCNYTRDTIPSAAQFSKCQTYM